MSKKTTRCFMVPIYIEVREGYDHATTLAGGLQFMEDHLGEAWADTERMIDAGQVEFDWTTRTAK